MALFTTEIVKELLGVSSSSICRTIFKEKHKLVEIIQSIHCSILRDFLLQFIAIFAVTICGLFWIHCVCIFVYSSNSTSYSCLYSSLLRYVYCLDLIEGSMAVVCLFTGFIADFIPLCVISGHGNLLSCNCWVDLNHSEVALFLT